MLTDVMKENVTNVLAVILIGGWINMTFLGFITKCYFQWPYVSLRYRKESNYPLLIAASWYFCCVFGLQSIHSPNVGQDNANDQSGMMETQMTGAAMAMPTTDTKKAFKTKWKVLELTDHQRAPGDVKEEHMAKHLHLEGIFKNELQTSFWRPTRD